MIFWSLGAALAGFYGGASEAAFSWAESSAPALRARHLAFVLLLVGTGGLALVTALRLVRSFRARHRVAAAEAASRRDVLTALSLELVARSCWLCLWASLGAWRAFVAWPGPPPSTPDAWIGRSHLVSVRGQVVESPLDVAPRLGARVVLGGAMVESTPYAARVMLSLPPGMPAPAPGACLTAESRLARVRGLANPDLPDPTLTMRAAGVALLGRAKTARLVPCTDQRAWPTRLRRWAFAWHNALAARVRERLPERRAAFVLAAALGERHAVPPDVEKGFRIAGATHVLSVSGLHLAVVLALAFTGLRRLLAQVPRLPLFVAPSTVAALGSLLFVVAFTLTSGEALATVRASVMAASMLLAFAVNRRANLARSLVVCVFLVLAVAPLALLDVSLQLSLLSVAALTVAARAGRPVRKTPVGEGTMARALFLLRAGFARVVALAGVSLAASLGTGPLVLHVFGEWAPGGVVGNLLLVPIVELAVVPLALGGAALACLWKAAGGLFLWAAGWGSALAMAIGARFAATGWLVHLPSPCGVATVLFTLAALGLIFVVAQRHPPEAWLSAPRLHRRKQHLRLVLVAALALAGSLLMERGFSSGRRPDETRVTFLDVGQGDAAVIESPGGHVVVVDGGGNEDGSFDPGEQVVAPFLRRRGVRHVDLVVLSHPHPDHMNGLLAVLSRFEVAALWTSGDDGKNPVYRQLLSLAKERKVATPVPSATALGPLSLVPLGPMVGDAVGPPEGVSVNDASLVVRASFGGRRVLFAGDLEAQGEDELAGRSALGVSAEAEVLKVPHHGSRTSSSPALLATVRPCWAVASLGFDNRFGFPHREVVSRYAALGVGLMRTDHEGAVTLTLTPEGNMSFSSVRGGGGALSAPCRSPPAR